MGPTLLEGPGKAPGAVENQATRNAVDHIQDLTLLNNR